MRHRCQKLVFQTAQLFRFRAEHLLAREQGLALGLRAQPLGDLRLQAFIALLQLTRTLGNTRFELLVRERQGHSSLVQVDKHAHLRAQDRRDNGRENVVNSPELIAPGRLHLVSVAGDEDDGRVPPVLVPPDEVGGLESVDVGHVDIEQQHGEFAFEHPLQRLGPRMRFDNLCVEILEQRAIDEELFRQVIDNENARARM